MTFNRLKPSWFQDNHAESHAWSSASAATPELQKKLAAASFFCHAPIGYFADRPGVRSA
jgi:hypothetical protein